MSAGDELADPSRPPQVQDRVRVELRGVVAGIEQAGPGGEWMARVILDESEVRIVDGYAVVWQHIERVSRERHVPRWTPESVRE